MTIGEYRKMSKPEFRYWNRVLGGRAEYEPCSLRLTPEWAEKHVYTPDFRTVGKDGRVTYHEVKGHYRLGSQDAARLRWCWAAITHPEADFVWAKEGKTAGEWKIEKFKRAGGGAIEEGMIDHELTRISTKLAGGRGRQRHDRTEALKGRP